MIFSINTMLNKENSGIEHAQLQRANVLREYKRPFKLVYFQNSQLLHKWTHYYGLSDDEVLNLYDWYQGRTKESSRVLGPDQIKLTNQPYRRVKDKNGVYLDMVNTDPNSKDGAIWGRIHTFKDEPNQVNFVEQFDGFGNLIRADFYDIRGFKSVSRYYNHDNQVDHVVWWDTKGQPVITEVMGSRADAKSAQPVKSWIVRAAGGMRVYNNEAQMVQGWLDELNDAYFDRQRPNIFVVDRTARTEFALFEFSQPAIKVFHLHNDHRSGMTDDPNSLLNNNYEYNFYNLRKFDFVITATQKQRRDVISRFHLPANRVVQIPVGLTHEHSKVKMSGRKYGSILVTARVAQEKRIEYMVEAVGMAMKEIPEIYLDVYGYIDRRNHDAESKAIQKVVRAYPGVEKHFKLHGYRKDLDNERDSHQVYLIASTMEGFNIALMQAQEHGEAALTVDVDYGPNELVVDGKNGYIIGSAKEMAQRLVELFKSQKAHGDASELQRLSDGAYALSKRYDSAHLMDGWSSLMKTAQEIWDKLPLDEMTWQEQGLEKTGKVDD